MRCFMAAARSCARLMPQLASKVPSGEQSIPLSAGHQSSALG